MPIVLKRAQIKRGCLGLDITVKSAKGRARSFAPSWNMVNGHKAQTLTDDQYTEMYHRMLSVVNIETWQWLHDEAEEGELTLLCYCRDEWFCHTHLLIAYAIEYFPDLFTKATNED